MAEYWLTRHSVSLKLLEDDCKLRKSSIHTSVARCIGLHKLFINSFMFSFSQLLGNDTISQLSDLGELNN